MHYVCTDNVEQQKQLQLQFSSRNGFFLVPNRNSTFISKMLSSISIQFFQNHIPPVVEKIKEMMINAMNCTYYLSSYREIMALIQKERNKINLFKEYIREMNTAFAQSPNQIDFQNESEDDVGYDEIFQQTLKGESLLLHSLEVEQLPLVSEIKIKCDSSQTNTQKTMQSDLCSTDVNGGTRKLSNFFNQAAYNRDDWKTQRKKQGNLDKSDSQQMRQFRKKGSTILDSNKDIEEIVIKQMEYDLTREINLAKNTNYQKHIQLEKYSYQKKIKDALVNYKLKIRRRK